jgi:hypothetical protein
LRIEKQRNPFVSVNESANEYSMRTRGFIHLWGTVLAAEMAYRNGL